MAEKITLQDRHQERQIVLSRLIVGGVIAFLLILLLFARLFYLQVNQHEYYSTKSDSYRIHVQPVMPTRGLIYDRNGVLLAENIPSFTLSLIKEHAGDIDRSIEIIREVIDFSEEDEDKFRTRLRNRHVPYAAVPVRYNLSEEEIARISVNQFRLPGVSVEAELVRHYPDGEAIAHAVGYLGSITEDELQKVDPVNYSGTHQIGKEGVEKYYEEVLHGQVGYETVEKNARGQLMKVLDRTDPVPGHDLVLNLDINLQKAAVEALGDYRGAIVALDANDGGILAMVSKPAFDSNLFVQGISRQEYAKLNDPVDTPMFNRALAKYAPGSTIKPFLGLAALDYKLRTREQTVNDPGYFKLSNAGHVYHDWTWWVNKSGHNQVDLQKAIFQSCDIYFYDLATDMGIDRMHEFLFRFGFGRNTTVDVARASSGTLPSRQWKRETLGQPWYPGDSLNSSIGQGYTEATPMQLATAAMVLANKGKWVKPSMLRQIGLTGQPVEPNRSLPDIELENPDDWNFIHESMAMVVHKGAGGYRETGTAYPYIAMNDPLAYRMAGKSGTAQVVGMPEDFDNDAEVPEKYRDHALFISFAPVENPQIAVGVFVEHGEGGSSVAGPIARKVLDAYLLDNGELKPEFRLPEISSEEETGSDDETGQSTESGSLDILAAQSIESTPLAGLSTIND